MMDQMMGGGMMWGMGLIGVLIIVVLILAGAERSLLVPLPKLSQA